MLARAPITALFALLCTACAGDGDVAGPEGSPAVDIDSATSTARDGGAQDAGSSADASLDGIPCDVSALLAARCTTCHGNPTRAGAPFPLVTYQELTTVVQGTTTRAQLALSAVQAGFMPPGGPLSNTDTETLRAWVQAGSPRGSCAPPMPTTPDAGAEFDTPSRCSSGKRWDDGDKGDEKMHPGRACITCHTSGLSSEQPRFTIAGTVYPSAHEPDECDGADDSSIRVLVKNATGQTVLTLRPNSAGNFFSLSPLPKPFYVEVEYEGRTRKMPLPPPSGDCNSCHTQRGTNGAPGRVLLP